MKRLWIALLLLLPSLCLAEDARTVCVISIHEDITQNTLYLVRRAVREASDKKAAAIVLDMDTNGGRVDMTEEIIRLLQHAPMKSYTFINVKAYSAGAFIACATDRIYMAPGSVIGAATPIMLVPGSGVQQMPKSYEEKINSAMRALIRSTAQQKGHNPEVFEAMVDADAGLTVDGKVITPKGKLLTLTSEEAVHEYGKPPRALLSAGTIKTVDELLAQVGLAGASTFEVKPYGFELVGRWITMISPLLILVGFVAIYFEMKVGGIGIPLLVAVLAFGLYFLGYVIAGLAGWEVVALFAAGLILVAVEIFVLPGHALPGVLGAVAMLSALVIAMVERFPGGPVMPTWPQLQLPLLKVMGAFAGAGICMLALGRYLPKSSLFKKFELVAATSAAAGYTTSAGAARSLLGATGVAETMLRPSGKGRFGEQLVDVVTEGDLIERGQPIKIVLVEGSRVVVTRAA